MTTVRYRFLFTAFLPVRQSIPVSGGVKLTVFPLQLTLHCGSGKNFATKNILADDLFLSASLSEPASDTTFIFPAETKHKKKHLWSQMNRLSLGQQLVELILDHIEYNKIFSHQATEDSGDDDFYI